MKRKTFICGLFALILLGFSAYLDSPYSFLNKNYAYSNDQPAAAISATAEPSTDVPETKEKLVKREKRMVTSSKHMRNMKSIKTKTVI